MKWLVNIASNYLKFLIRMVVVFLMTPYIIKQIGVEEFGLWSLVYAIIGLFGLLDFGFATAAIKYVGEAFGARDFSRLNQAISSLTTVYLLIGFVCLLLVFLLASPLSGFFEIPQGHAGNFTTILIIVGLFVALSFPLSIYKAILIGSGYQSFISLFEVSMVLVNAGLVVYLLENGYGIIGMAWSAALTTLGSLLLAIPVVKRKVPEIQITFSIISFSRIRELMSFSVYQFITNIAVLLVMGIDPIVVGMFLPLSAVALYSIAGRIGEYSFLLNKQFSNALTPLISQAQGGKRDDLIRRILLDGTRFLMAIALPFLALLYFYAPNIIHVWVGPDFAESSELLRILLIAIFFSTLQLNASSVLAMTGHHRFLALTMMISALLNFVLSVILVQFMGLAGVALATLIASFTMEMLIIVPRACRSRQAGWFEFLLKGLVPTIFPALPMLFVAYELSLWQKPESLGLIVLHGSISALVYFVMFFWTGVKSSERRMVYNKLRALAG